MRDGAGNPGCFLGVNIYFHNIAILFMFCYTKYEYLVCERRVLLVEDNEIYRMVLHEILDPTYIVLEAENGQETLSILNETGDAVTKSRLQDVLRIRVKRAMQLNPQAAGIARRAKT